MNITITTLTDAFWFYIGMTLFIALGVMFIAMTMYLLWQSFMHAIYCIKREFKFRKMGIKRLREVKS